MCVAYAWIHHRNFNINSLLYCLSFLSAIGELEAYTSPQMHWYCCRSHCLRSHMGCISGVGIPIPLDFHHFLHSYFEISIFNGHLCESPSCQPQLSHPITVVFNEENDWEKWVPMSLLKIHANRNSLFHRSNHDYYLLFLILYIFMSKMKMIVSKCMKLKSSLEVFFSLFFLILLHQNPQLCE